jgi:uncharacterized protein (TIGR00255 family)
MVKQPQPPRAAIRTVSMTGFASGQGAGHDHDWSWEIRSVNGKGLDLRLRLPELEGLEAGVRREVAAVARRGNIQLTLRLSRQGGGETLRVNHPALEAALDAVMAAEVAAKDRGVTIVAPNPVEILAMRGVLEQSLSPLSDPKALCDALLDDVQTVLADFLAMRMAEGGELGQVIATQIERITELTQAAEHAAAARRSEVARALRDSLTRVMEGAHGADEARVSQELALLAVKADITEEIDRLRAHIAAAWALLADPGAVGRKFEFLTQEFVREANTLCSKSNDAALTAIGLDLKYAIDQMREQIQNVE